MKRNPWPYTIIAYFVIFAATMAGWITFAVHNDMQLVRADYYDHEMKFQQQIDRLARTSRLPKKVHVLYKPAERVVTVSLPSAHSTSTTFGKIQFYRPADASLDQSFDLIVDAQGSQKIDVAALRSGLWKLHIS